MFCITFDALPEDRQELEGVRQRLIEAGYNPSPIAYNDPMPGFDVTYKDDATRRQILRAGAVFMGVTYRTEDLG